ncbi:MAG: 4Fe-4S ferredoxin, partial [Bradyrhizobium sp.]|nr:4Fe-4S ferredoxin [Bradyrhizobium sp.]
MQLDTAAIKRGCRDREIATFRQLCRAELKGFRDATTTGSALVVGCTQEAPLFCNEAEDRSGQIDFVNLRETAGWSSQGSGAGAKMAALLAAACERKPAYPFVTFSSEGVTLIYGREEAAIEAGTLLADHLDVTVMLTSPSEIIPPPTTSFPVVKGTIKIAKGHFGAFELTTDDHAMPRPSSRGALMFEAPRDGLTSRCDLILDLSGGAPLFPAHDLRDGYLRADPRNPSAVLRAVLKARDLVGRFDKPKYVDFTAEICAHSRSGLT